MLTQPTRLSNRIPHYGDSHTSGINMLEELSWSRLDEQTIEPVRKSNGKRDEM